jgi:hypothetical protein
LTLPLVFAYGCAGGAAEVEEVTAAFVEAVKNRDSARIEGLMDWERYYTHGRESGGTEGEVKPEDVEAQKALLLTVLAKDSGLALRYRTAEHTVKNISIDGDEASSEVLQVDRASGETRLIKFLLAKSDGWKIYRFSTEEIGES